VKLKHTNKVGIKKNYQEEDDVEEEFL